MLISDWSSDVCSSDLHMHHPDGALACGVMHVLFRDGFADRAYLAQYTSGAAELESHLQDRGPAWAAAITGLPEAEIIAFAHLPIGRASCREIVCQSV